MGKGEQRVNARLKGGIEPLCLSAPTDLKSAPRTSEDHSGARLCVCELPLYKSHVSK